MAQSGKSEDMLVDSINEALFDLVGDTVIEFGSAGPQIIEDYEADVRGYLDHE
ncbi:MAG: tellurite resistance TerB C-terminal domain-containing protein [Collinsella sp.]